MHRQDALFGHQVIHDREYTFFHFTGVLRSQNHHFPLFKTESNTGFGSNAIDAGIGVVPTGIVNYIIGFAVRLQFFAGWANQHVVHKQCVVGPLANDPDFDPEFWIPARIAVDDVQPRAFFEVTQRLFANLIK